jgi:four helix bundle protein
VGFFKFERLEVWKRSLEWADTLFDVADGLPQKYQFSLGEQLRRAALSVPTNIAEGSGRDGEKESAYFYRIAKGSVYEVVSLLAIAGKRGCLEREAYRSLYAESNEIAAMLTALMKSLFAQ